MHGTAKGKLNEKFGEVGFAGFAKKNNSLFFQGKKLNRLDVQIRLENQQRGVGWGNTPKRFISQLWDKTGSSSPQMGLGWHVLKSYFVIPFYFGYREYRKSSTCNHKCSRC